MVTDRLVLVPSPLLGPAVWRPVADVLADHGRDVSIAAAYRDVATAADVLEHLLGAVPLDTQVVLVLHSNAGLYAAALAAQREVSGLVFVDAGLPTDAATTPTAPRAFREFLSSLADADGLLPGWTRWWSAEDLIGLFPDEEARRAVEAEQPRLPLAYFDDEVLSPGGWSDLPGAYVALGDAYAAEAGRAEALGWPVLRLTGHHLHPLVDPEGVAAVLLGLLRRMGRMGL